METKQDVSRGEKQSSTFKWLNKHCKLSKGETPNLVSLNGGKWLVPHDLHPKFYQQYKRDVEDSFTMYLVERKGAINPVIVDLDMDKLGKKELTNPETGKLIDMRKLAAFCLWKLADLCNHYLGSHIETEGLADWHLSVRDDNVHAVCRKAFVTEQQMQALFAEMRDDLLGVWPGEPWAKVVDGIKNGGLRMIGSSKTDDNGIYLPVDADWHPVAIDEKTLSDHSLLHVSTVLTSKWDGGQALERAEISQPFNLPRLDAVGDWKEYALQVAREDLKMPCTIRKAAGNRFTFNTTAHRPCIHGQTGHDSNGFSLVFCTDGAILYKCLQDDCRVKPAKEVARWPVPCLFSVRPDGTSRAPDTCKFAEETLFDLCEEWYDAKVSQDVLAMSTKFKACMAYINAFHIHLTASAGQIIRYERDSDGVMCKYESWSVTNFMINYGTCCHQVFKSWLSSTDRHRKAKQTFDPNEARVADDTFNTFMGHAAEREARHLQTPDMIVLEPVFKMLRHLVDHDQAMFDYVLKWHARILQTGLKNQTILSVCSEPGSGKGTFFDEIMAKRVFGCDGATHGTAVVCDKLKPITGRFNSVACGRQYIIANEVEKLDNCDLCALRSRSTDPSEMCEKKGVEPYIIPHSSCNIVMLGNFEYIKSIDPSERRFVIIKPSKAHIQDPAVFQPVYDVIDKVGPHMYVYLMQMDLTGFNPWTDRPRSTHDTDMRRNGMHPVAQYLAACIEVNRIIVADNLDGKLGERSWPAVDPPNEIPTGYRQIKDKDSVFNGFCNWVKRELGQKQDPKGKVFSAKLKELGGIESAASNGVRYYKWLSVNAVRANLTAARQWVD